MDARRHINDQYRRCAADGYTIRQTADELGVSYVSALNAETRLGIRFARVAEVPRIPKPVFSCSPKAIAAAIAKRAAQ